MNTSALKKFAQAARRQLLEEVAARMEQVLRSDSVEIREKEQVVKELQNQIKQSSKKAVIDQVAYTWFNRFCALRYMDVNHYTRMGIISPQEGYTQPEILQEAKQGVIDDDFKVDKQKVIGLLNGQLPSSNPQQEAYRLLIVGACNAYHARMPFLFPEIDDYTELLMPADLLSENSILQGMREVLTVDSCKDVEVIGWLYQFYISERKDEVFAGLKKNKKIEAEDIPAATQLFTPHWIVRYLVENSLGRLWMLNNPDSKLIDQMDYYIKPEEPETDFLKITSPEEIKVCDPACGSGHMLTYAFDLLYAIYEEQGYDRVQIPGLILENNLYGIEIDQRAGHLAAFALMMKAREKDRRFFTREIEPGICVLRNTSFSPDEITRYKKVVGPENFTQDFWLLLQQFEKAETFGSLIRPVISIPSSFVRDWEEGYEFNDLFLQTTHKKIKQVCKWADYLSAIWHVVVSNPPYMGGKGMNSDFKAFLSDQYPDVKSDTFSAFIIRNLEISGEKAQLGFMTPYVWMFISSYEKLRNYLIKRKTITSLVQLEYSGFDGATVPICTFTLENSSNLEYKGAYIRLSDFRGVENQSPKTLEAIQNPECGWFYRASAADFKKIPGAPIAYWVSDKIFDLFSGHSKIGKLTISDGQTKTGDNNKYLRQRWEVEKKKIGSGRRWWKHPKGGPYRKWFGNVDWVINWSEEARKHYRRDRVARILPEYLWGKPGLTWTLITSGDTSFRLLEPGQIFNLAAPSLFFHNEEQILLVLGLVNTNFVNYILKILNPTLNLNIGEIQCIPILDNIYTFESQIKEIVKKCIDITKTDWDYFEISCDYEAHPLINYTSSSITLRFAYFSLRKEWSKQTVFLQNLEKENNEIFLKVYNLQTEFKDEVPLSRITLNSNPYYRYDKNKSEDELEVLLLDDTMKEFISYAVGCMMGRYSLDKEGLILANAGETIEEYLQQVPEPTFMPDEDNVIPILDGEWFEDDIVERFKEFLKLTFGEENYEENLAFLEEAIGRDIRSYFVRDFYNEHIKMYKKRPIYWLFSSPKCSFNALIYMHRYTPDTVSLILNEYLIPYRDKLKAHKDLLETRMINPNASQGEKSRASKEVDKINSVLSELKDYEDEVLYPLATQRIEIDLDDGVLVNYNKFDEALKEVKGLSEK